ncbi:MAG: hypothetical protein AAGI03_17055 [Pseudomonadota bacterium]
MEDAALTILGLAFFAVIAVAAMLHQQAKLDNQQDYSVVYVSQLPGLMSCRTGPVRAVLHRQSGNIYRDLGEFDDPMIALNEVTKSFNRAKIESVMVRENNKRLLEVWRAFYGHGGKAEGKKLGGSVIQQIGSSCPH